MAGRAHGAKRGVGATILHRPHRGQASASGQGCRVPRTRTGIRIGVQSTATGGANPLNAIEVCHRMHPFEVATCGRYRQQRLDCVTKPGQLHAVEHGL